MTYFAKIAAFLVLVVSPISALAEDCSYCSEIETIKQELAKLRPDSMNEATIDRQNALVDQSKALAIRVLAATRSGPPSADWSRVIGLLAHAVPFDYENTMSEDILAALCPGRSGGSCTRGERVPTEISRALNEGVINQAQAFALRTAFGTAQGVIEHGTDPEDPSKKNH